MYKSKLQELCQQRKWDLPEYLSAKDGPDHNLRFTATVTVGGVSFSTEDLSRNSKEAQNKAAKLAFDHFTTASLATQSTTGALQPPPVSASPTASAPRSHPGITDDARHLYKNRLQNYAAKRNITLPEYSCEHEGPPHACRFRCNVMIGGKSFGSPEFFSSIKEAEHAAAKIAWESLSLDEVEQDDSAVYKNLLHEFARKRGYQMPKYETTFSGPPHMLVFVSTVNIQGQVFEGQAAKSKKQGEANAAKVAYFSLQNQPLHKDDQSTIGGGQHYDRSPGTCRALVPPLEADNDAKKPRFLPSSDSVCASMEDPFHATPSSLSDFPPSKPVNFESSSLSWVKKDNGQLVGSRGAPLLTNEKILIQPCGPNMVMPDGATVLPFSDDKWLALKINSNQS